MTKLRLTALALAAGIATFGVCAPASAATVCATTDITPTAQACAGFYNGNLLSNSAADITAQHNALALLGFNWDNNWAGVELISGLAGSHNVNFATLLQGVSYVAFHYGNGRGGPGQATAFYRLDAGTGVDIINLAYNASSNAVLYSTTPMTGVPEPLTWAMMFAGFAMVGASMRRRSRPVSVTA